MKVILLTVGFLSGCSQLMVVKKTLDVALSDSVAAYCKLPESVRLANRARIAAKVYPNKIEIVCGE